MADRSSSPATARLPGRANTDAAGGAAGAPGETDPVTVAVSRVIHPGRERDFALWAQEIDTLAQQFPGHLGSVRLQDGDGVNHLVYRFESPERLRAWEASPARQRLLARGDRISDERRVTTRLPDAWFAIPTGTASRRWKAFLATWLAVFPTLLAITYALTAIAPDLWRPAQLAVSSALLTALLTWVIMPRVTRTARPWLHRDSTPVPLANPGPRA